MRVRSERTDAEQEYELINNLLCMRRLRRSLTDEEYVSDKVRAKDGMRLARENGFKMDYIGVLVETSRSLISGIGLPEMADHTWTSSKPRSQSLLRR